MALESKCQNWEIVKRLILRSHEIENMDVAIAAKAIMLAGRLLALRRLADAKIDIEIVDNRALGTFDTALRIVHDGEAFHPNVILLYYYMAEYGRATGKEVVEVPEGWRVSIERRHTFW